MARKILLADDSVTAQNMGRKILVDAGYDVLTVNNGSAALKRITEAKPDLIVLDVYMPGYSGLEVCQRLKDSPATAHIPVLLSVGKLEPFKPQEARRVKADAHIVKPFEASELLSAIARLEDSIVPQAHGPSFCSPLPGAAEFDEEVPTRVETADSDRGRKNGGRSSKKNEGSNPDEAVANFRDFRKVKEKSAAGASGTESQDAGPAPHVPRDITPEELSALSDLAAKLDETGPEAQTADAAPEIATPEVATAEVAAPEVAAKDPADEAAASAGTAWNEVAIPAEHVEPATAVAAAQTEAPSAELQAAPEVPAQPLVNAASFAQEPAPVDQQDEPMFATAPAQEKIEAQPVKTEQPLVEAAIAEGSTNQDSISSEAAPAVAADSEEPVEKEAPAPTDEELAEALRLLTPATGPGETMPAQDSLMATGLAAYISAQNAGVNLGQAQTAADEKIQYASNDTRWMAEAVKLTAEEAAVSLEAEMFRTFAAAATAEIGSTPVVSRVSAIAAAIENRLAEANLTGAETAQVESAPGEAPKAMAAAAAADGSSPPGTPSTPAPATEENAIASIVDRVLADLRPKIVAEIAKSLGKK